LQGVPSVIHHFGAITEPFEHFADSLLIDEIIFGQKNPQWITFGQGEFKNPFGDSGRRRDRARGFGKPNSLW
jgi:hypothetical protein